MRVLAIYGAAMVQGQGVTEDAHGDGDEQQIKVDRKFLAMIGS